MSAARITATGSSEQRRRDRRLSLLRLTSGERITLRRIAEITGWAPDGALRTDATGLVCEGLLTVRRGRYRAGYQITELGREYLTKNGDV